MLCRATLSGSPFFSASSHNRGGASMRGGMKRAIGTSIVVGFAIAAVAAQGRRSGEIQSLRTPIDVTAERVDRLERWLEAVDAHEAGEADAALDEVASWSTGDLRQLWGDVRVPTILLRNRRAARFLIPTTGGRTMEVFYPPSLMRRMRALACAAAGRLADVDCVAKGAPLELSAALRRFAERAGADRSRTGEDNYFLRRAAILHADVEILAPSASAAAPPRQAPIIGPSQIRVDTSDGVSLDVREVGIHWELGRMVLDQVVPKGAERPQPGRDAMVRDWYRASAAWMQHIESHDTKHIDHGRDIFPADPDILFLSGALHETYARPAIQSAVRAATVPSGYSIDILSSRVELRRAESFFRGALAQAPDMAEAHLRLGRVLGLLGQHADAIVELRRAAALLGDDDELRYDGELFAGAEEEALGRYDAARDAYARAQSLFPGAQSPLIALSQLARRRGDRAAALAAIQQLFELPPPFAEGRDDPWWQYHKAQARSAEAWIDALRSPFRTAR